MGEGELIGERRARENGPVAAPRGGSARGVKFTAVTRRLGPDVRVCIGTAPEELRLGQFVVALVRRAGSGPDARDPSGRPVRLYDGDLIAGAWSGAQGDPPERTSLRTAGGLIGETTGHGADAPELEVVGFVADRTGEPLTTGGTASMPPRHAIPAIGTIAVINMDGCAERAAAAVVNGWTRTGFAVGAGRVAGEENGTHRWAMLDAGAHATSDFLDFGMPSTHAYPVERQAATTLAIRDALVADGAQIVVLQVDDAARPETEALLGRLASVADAAVVCFDGEAGVRAAMKRLRGLVVPVRAITGAVADDAVSALRISSWSRLPVRPMAELGAGAAVGLLGHDEPRHGEC